MARRLSTMYSGETSAAEVQLYSIQLRAALGNLVLLEKSIFDRANVGGRGKLESTVHYSSSRLFGIAREDCCADTVVGQHREGIPEDKV